MLDAHQVEDLALAAKPYYSDEIEYHNWSHAEAVLSDVKILADRVMGRGIHLSREALAIAAAWHDAGYHENHERLGFSTKEHYSAQLADDFLISEAVHFETRTIVKRAILGTIHGAHREGIHGLILHRADISNVGGPYADFLAKTTALWQEHETMTGQRTLWSKHVEGTQKFIAFSIKEALEELPILGETVGENDSFDTVARNNSLSLGLEKRQLSD